MKSFRLRVSSICVRASLSPNSYNRGFTDVTVAVPGNPRMIDMTVYDDEYFVNFLRKSDASPRGFCMLALKRVIYRLAVRFGPKPVRLYACGQLKHDSLASRDRLFSYYESKGFVKDKRLGSSMTAVYETFVRRPRHSLRLSNA